jgi:hypothetical protein
VAHDRRQHAVHVEQDRAVLRIGLQRREQLVQCRGGGHRPSMPTISRGGTLGEPVAAKAAATRVAAAAKAAC